MFAGRTKPGKFQEWHLLHVFILLIMLIVDLGSQISQIGIKNIYPFSNLKKCQMCLFQMCVRRFIAGGDRLSDSAHGWHPVMAMSGLWPV